MPIAEGQPIRSSNVARRCLEYAGSTALIDRLPLIFMIGINPRQRSRLSIHAVMAEVIPVRILSSTMDLKHHKMHNWSSVSSTPHIASSVFTITSMINSLFTRRRHVLYVSCVCLKQPEYSIPEFVTGGMPWKRTTKHYLSTLRTRNQSSSTTLTKTTWSPVDPHPYKHLPRVPPRHGHQVRSKMFYYCWFREIWNHRAGSVP